MRKRQNSIKSQFAIALIAASLVGTLGIKGQNVPSRPQLVVGVMVNGLQAEYLDLLSGYFTDGGFKRLLNKGVVIPAIDYGTTLDPVAATALIYTGAPASVNGIPSQSIYNPERRTAYSTLLDASKIGNYTDETLSPQAIAVSTLSDEIRIDNGGVGYVYSIATSPEQAIIMAGHAANSAFWINDVSGKWATTTYYKEVPGAVASRNLTRPLAVRIDSMQWTPSIPLEKYPDIPDYKRYYPFRHTFGASNPNRFRWFKSSALGNREVAELANDYIRQLRIGKRGTMDMLNLAFNLVPFPGAKDSDSRIELMDSYLRLDAELAKLFQNIDNTVGINNTIVFLAGTPLLSSDKPDDARWGIPSGEFSPRKAISLLNMYLMALHGNGEWVIGYHNNQFYLNRQLVKERSLDERILRRDAADFLVRMAGVTEAWTIDDIINARVGRKPHAIKQSVNVNKSGDIYITVNPGWEIYDDTVTPSVRTLQRNAPSTAPLLLMAPQLAPTTINSTVDALDIAPTISRILRIRSPNGASVHSNPHIYSPLLK